MSYSHRALSLKNFLLLHNFLNLYMLSALTLSSVILFYSSSTLGLLYIIFQTNFLLNFMLCSLVTLSLSKKTIQCLRLHCFTNIKMEIRSPLTILSSKVGKFTCQKLFFCNLPLNFGTIFADLLWTFSISPLCFFRCSDQT